MEMEAQFQNLMARKRSLRPTSIRLSYDHFNRRMLWALTEETAKYRSHEALKEFNRNSDIVT